MVEAEQFSAGDFEIEKAYMISSTGEEQNIATNIIGLRIWEDIELPVVHGELTMYNTVSFADEFPMIGSEKLELVLKTPAFTGKKIDIQGEKAFWIYQCTQREHQRNLQIFTLKFCSPEMAINSSKNFSQSIEGTASEIVSKIMKTHIKTVKDISFHDTQDRKNIVFSNTHPYSAISQLTSDSISSSQQQPGYYFFENLDGFHYKNIENMAEGPIVWDYQVDDTGAADITLKDGPRDYDLEMHTILVHKMNHPDRSMDIRSGALGSTLIVHDIFNKQFKIKKYNSTDNFNKEIHVGKKGSKSIPVPNLPGLDLPENLSRIYYRPMSVKVPDGKSDLKGTNGLYSGKHKLPVSLEDVKLQQRDSQRHQLSESFNLEITVHGNTFIRVGDIVKIKMLKASELDNELTREALDNFYKGNFLITKIQHKFLRHDMSHLMLMSLVRDSIPIEN